MGKLVNTRLHELGAARVYRHGEGDDDGNLEEDFDAWRSDGLWTALQSASTGGSIDGTTAAAPTSPKLTAASTTVPATQRKQPRLVWRFVSVPAPAGTVKGALPTLPTSVANGAALASASDLSSRHFYTAVSAPVVCNRELRRVVGVGASTRHVEIDVGAVGLKYRTADNLYVVPENDAAEVTALARALHWDPDMWFTLELDAEAAEAEGVWAGPPSPQPPPPFPVPTSVRAMLTRYVDLSGQPRRDLALALASYARSAADKTRLEFLGSKDGKAEWATWVVAAERSIGELLHAFSSLELPVGAAAQLLPRMQPRAYTIASSSLVSPRVAAIVATVVDVPKPATDDDVGSPERRLRGVATNHLLRIAAAPSTQPPPALRVYIRTSAFLLPADATRPVILVGPGTGFAPMRAFLQEREYQRAAGTIVGPTALFFGCRRRDEDYIYEDEMQRWVANGTLDALHVAFSRDSSRKVRLAIHMMAPWC